MCLKISKSFLRAPEVEEKQKEKNVKAQNKINQFQDLSFEFEFELWFLCCCCSSKKKATFFETFLVVYFFFDLHFLGFGTFGQHARFLLFFVAKKRFVSSIFIVSKGFWKIWKFCLSEKFAVTKFIFKKFQVKKVARKKLQIILPAGGKTRNFFFSIFFKKLCFFQNNTNQKTVLF